MQLHQKPAPANPPAITATVTCPANVRLAGTRDEPAILDLLLEDLEENAKTIAPISLSRLSGLIAYATRGHGGFALVIDGDDGQPVAVAILQPDQWWWSDQVFLREIMLYVSPPARHGHAGADLLAYEKWLADSMSEAQGERIYLLSGVTGTKRLPAKLRLYGQHMDPVGGFFCYPSIDGGLAL